MKYFDFETSFDTDDFGLITVHAVGSISDYYPSKTHNAYGDPGYDAEGGEIEGLENGSAQRTLVGVPVA